LPELALPIETERLRLRRFAREDVAALHAIQSREDVTRWLPWGPRSEDDVRASIERHNAIAPDDGVVLAVEHDGELIGTVNLQVGEHRQGEIGYLLHPDHHGRGFATEATAALLALAFETYGLHRVCGRMEPRNEASARVLERLGMRREAHLIENELVHGEWQSEAIYALLAREWRDELAERRSSARGS
jgi:RimJ/RimL family protein N-acetyltransferase